MSPSSYRHVAAPAGSAATENEQRGSAKATTGPAPPARGRWWPLICPANVKDAIVSIQVRRLKGLYVYVNGKRIVRTRDPTVPGPGRVGIGVGHAQAVFRYAKFLVPTSHQAKKLLAGKR